MLDRSDTSADQEGASERPVAQEAPDLGWLQRMGVVSIDEHGGWTLTDLGQRALARFHSSADPTAASTRSRS